MSDYTPHANDTFLVPSGIDGDHLHIILTEACHENFHIVVGISSIKEGSRQNDFTCRLEAGEHEFIKKPSFAFYKHARHDSVAHLQICVGKNFTPKAPATTVLVEKILSGIPLSDHTKPFITRCYEKRCK